MEIITMVTASENLTTNYKLMSAEQEGDWSYSRRFVSTNSSQEYIQGSVLLDRESGQNR
jgi:hypothetical protein